MNNAINVDKKYILIGYSFDDTTPYLVLDSISNSRQERLIFKVRGESFSLTRFNKRYCIGRYNIADFSSTYCPNRAELSGKHDVCMDCFRFIGFNPAFYNTTPDKLSQQQKEYNEAVHDVYLAYFGADVIKVGIAHGKRTLTRWCEQGARAATILKKCTNAYEARDLEKKVAQQTNVVSTVTVKKKCCLISKPYLFETAKQELQQVRDCIKNEINSKVMHSEIIDLQKYYVGDNVVNPHIVDVSHDKPLYISGKVVGMIGNLLIVEQKDRQFMVSLKFMISYLVQITNEIKEHYRRPIQMKLF